MNCHFGRVDPPVTVDYDDLTLRPFEVGQFFNVNPRIVPEHFPLLHDAGVSTVQFHYLVMDEVFTTSEALEAIRRSTYFRPDFAMSVAYLRSHRETHPTIPVISFCGREHSQSGHPFIPYLHADVNGMSLFFNWMGFRRAPGCHILVAEPAPTP